MYLEQLKHGIQDILFCSQESALGKLYGHVLCRCVLLSLNPGRDNGLKDKIKR